MVFIILGHGLLSGSAAFAQQGPNDTIRLGAVVDNGRVYPYVFLEDYTCKSQMLNAEDRKRLNKLRNSVNAVYSYAITASAIFNEMHAEMEKMDRRRDRKKFKKEWDQKLNMTFKKPLKDLSVDQGHILIKLIARQTGQDCYSVIREMKGGLSAMMWQSVGVFFNNNLKKDYDPQGEDKELERIVKELEESNQYRYQLYLQDEMMKKIGKR